MHMLMLRTKVANITTKLTISKMNCVLWNFEDAMVHISLEYHNSETYHSWNALPRKTFEPADFVLPRVSQHMRSDEDVVLVFSARKRVLAVKVQKQSVNESMIVL